MKNIISCGLLVCFSLSAVANMSGTYTPDLSDIPKIEPEYFQRTYDTRKTGKSSQVRNQIKAYGDRLGQSIAFMRASLVCFDLKESAAGAKQEYEQLTEELGLEAGEILEFAVADNQYENQSSICQEMRKDTLAAKIKGIAQALNMTSEQVAAAIERRSYNQLRLKETTKSVKVQDNLRQIMATAKQKADQQIAAGIERALHRQFNSSGNKVLTADQSDKRAKTIERIRLLFKDYEPLFRDIPSKNIDGAKNFERDFDRIINRYIILEPHTM